MDFPGNALTNFYVLHDFTDIAYAVCVVTALANDATKGSTSPSLTPAYGPSTARLRKAEREIRKIGIFVSSDPIRHEIFTFFRKADLQRDGKSIFSRLVAVLRSNMCTISDKKAARALDLLQPENGRLHRLFISALTPSIRSVIVNLRALLPCGMATFVTQIQREEGPESHYIESIEGKLFRLLDMDTQLLGSGNLLISFRHRRSVHLSQPKVWDEDPKNGFLNQRKGLNGKLDRTLVLAPSGQIARHARGQALPGPESQVRQPSNTEPSSMQTPFQFESSKREIWQAMVESWLANQGIDLQSSDQETWLDVELQVRTASQSPIGAGSPKVGHSQSSTTWQSFRWPASLCFDLPKSLSTTPAPNEEDSEIRVDDPLLFAEDWFLGTATRTKVAGERRASRRAMEELDHLQNESENIFQNPLFPSSPTLHRHAIGDVSMSNNIYPTPPDGPISQVTPGMSSMDGVVVTPADQNQQLPEASQKNDDENMQEINIQEGDLAIGTGQYDEDLFGDIPVETFGPSGIADEPNWDFFDGPDLDMVTAELDPEISSDVENSHNLNLGESDTPDPSSNVPKNVNPSPMMEDPKNVEHDLDQMEDICLNTHQQMHIDSPKSEVENLPGEDLKVVSPESTIPGQLLPPLSELEVKNAVADIMLLPRHSKKNTEPSTRWGHEISKESLINTVHAGREAQISDNKYSANGRFWFGNANANFNEAPKMNAGVGIPKIGFPPFGSSSGMSYQIFDRLNDEGGHDMAHSESRSSAEQSDLDSSGFLSNPNEPGTPSADTTREWTKYVPSSPRYSKKDGDTRDEQEVRNEFDQLLDCLRIDDEKATSPIYERQTPESGITSTKSENNIMMAQILVDQLTQSSLHDSIFSLPKEECMPLLDDDISKELGEAYGTAEHVNLLQLARASCAGNDDVDRISKLSDTNISIFRDGKPLTALSTILPFWDELGLQPAGGRKNITGLCLHPQGSNVRDGCRVFIDRLEETYENCNLGDHTTGMIAGTTNDGLVEWSVTENSLPNLLQTCERVGTALSRLPATDDNIMIYMIVPQESEEQLLVICGGFMALWSTYVKTCGKKQRNELALQLIPMSFVALPETLAIPAQSEYLTLAIEVYNRCPPSDLSDEIARYGSAIVLAEHVNAQLEFDLAGTAQSPFEKHGRCLHLAYSESKDNRWVTAAWTDTLGHTALTMSYCLRQRGSRVSRPISEIIKELWEISVDIMQKSRTKWRLVVAKEGRATPTEINDWAVLVNHDVVNGQAFQPQLVLLSIDSEPSLSLRLSPHMVNKILGGVTQQQSGLYGTPASTPQASITSPDQTTIATPTPGGTALNAPTPPEHTFDPNAETDLSLADPIDGTWSVILSHGINQANSILEARPALASGYLLKRRGPTDADNVVALEVNLVQTALTSSSERQDLLKEILSQYKDLVTLTRTRGVSDPVSCVLPWHIATAIKGQHVLRLIM